MQEDHDRKPKLILDSIIQIQEALLPLGYEVRGYRDGFCSNNGLTIYLAKSFPENLKSLSSVDKPFAFDNTDNGFQGTE